MYYVGHHCDTNYLSYSSVHHEIQRNPIPLDHFTAPWFGTTRGVIPNWDAKTHKVAVLFEWHCSLNTMKQIGLINRMYSFSGNS